MEPSSANEPVQGAGIIKVTPATPTSPQSEKKRVMVLGTSLDIPQRTASTVIPPSPSALQAAGALGCRGSAVHIMRKGGVPMVHCPDCGDDITFKDFPNHRDRLRKVEIEIKPKTWFQRYVLIPLIDILSWMLVNVFFREVAVVGLENIPKEGPVVFYGNHQNQFMDAIIIRAHCGRPVRFIIAEKSMHRPVIRQFAQLMNAVPVVRPQDVPSTPGTGGLVKVDGKEVYGEGTKFKQELSHGDVIAWRAPGSKERCQGQVVAIESDTRLQLSLNTVEDEQFEGAKTDYSISKRIDHSEMYADVYSTMESGGAIGIFPEGGSHDRTSLQPLKAGVVLFTLGAAERGIFPSVIPCGLTYFYGHRFRSRAHIEFGTPIVPTVEVVEGFAANKRETTGRILKELDKALRDVTINVPDWPTLKFLHSFRQLYHPPGCTLETKDYLKLTRRLAKITNEYDEDPDFMEFRNKVENYYDYCSALMIRDSQVQTLGSLQDESVIFVVVRRCVALFILGFVLIPFFIINGPIGILASLGAETHARTALNSSKVKVCGQDVKASYKIVFGFTAVPIYYSALSMCVWLYSDFRTALTVALALPMAMYVSLLIIQEFVMEMRATLPLIMSILAKHRQFVRLFERRRKLTERAKEVVSKFDPLLERDMLLSIVEEPCRQPSLFSIRHASRRVRKQKAM